MEPSDSAERGTAHATASSSQADKEVIELLTDSDEEEVIDLAGSYSDSDSESDVLEVHSSDPDDVEWEFEICYEKPAPADPSTPPAAHQQQQHPQVLLVPRQQGSQRSSERTITDVYVDGSFRPSLPEALRMSCGVYVKWQRGIASGLSAAYLLQPNSFGGLSSTVAELGAVFMGAELALGCVANGSIKAAAIRINTDCQSLLDTLKKNPGKIKQKNLRSLVTAVAAKVQEVKAHVPVTIRWVKGHGKGCSADTLGNRAADRLARKCDIHAPIRKLPG